VKYFTTEPKSPQPSGFSSTVSHQPHSNAPAAGLGVAMNIATSFTLMLAQSLLVAFSSHGAETLVEVSPELKPPGFLGTVNYTPTKQEKTHYNRLDEPQRVTLKEKDRVFSLKGHEGQFVSWFGIVREITTDKEGLVTNLLIENKYSHDLSDAHIQTVSINGAGDFRVELATHSKDILPLILVRVYGDVVEAKDDIPLVKAKYIRIWHWFDFNFSDYGQDQSNPRWLKKRKSGIRVYSSKVSGNYYIERLGPTDQELKRIKQFDINAQKAKSNDK